MDPGSFPVSDQCEHFCTINKDPLFSVLLHVPVPCPFPFRAVWVNHNGWWHHHLFSLLYFCSTRHFGGFLIETNFSAYSDVIFRFPLRELPSVGLQKYKTYDIYKRSDYHSAESCLWTCNFTVILFLGKWIHSVIYLSEVDFDVCTMYFVAGTQWWLLAQNLPQIEWK